MTVLGPAFVQLKGRVYKHWPCRQMICRQLCRWLRDYVKLCLVWFVLDVRRRLSRCWQCNTQLHRCLCSCWSYWQSQARTAQCSQQTHHARHLSRSTFATFTLFLFCIQ